MPCQAETTIYLSNIIFITKMQIMKNVFLSIFLFIAVLCCSSCNDDPRTPTPPTEVANRAYILNYGNFGGTKSNISLLDIDSAKISHQVYLQANGVGINSNVQSMFIHQDVLYLMSNNGDKIDIIDPITWKALANPISEGVTNNRYMVAQGNTAYVSCWGNVQDWSKMESSYILKLNLSTQTHESIPLPGGTEGLLLTNNHLYIGLSSQARVAVMDLATEVISYIDMPAIPQHFAIDAQGRIWTSLVSTYSHTYPDSVQGFAIIDPTSLSIQDFINLPACAGNFHMDNKGEHVYTTTGATWPETKSYIWKINTSQQNAEILFSEESVMHVNVNPDSKHIYVLSAPDATSAGVLNIYNDQGLKQNSYEVGIYPQQLIFYRQKK